MSAEPPILILHVTGTNRDREAAWACELAGGAPEIMHVNRIIAGERRLADYRMIVLPGGFSYGDDLGAGRLWAVLLRHRLGDDLQAFVAAGRPVLGICNGFQALVKAGLLQGSGVRSRSLRRASREQGSGGKDQAAETGSQGSGRLLTPDPCFLTPELTLTRNDSARFECRWVYLASQQPLPASGGSACVFTHGLTEPIYCPVAHGEGKFVARDGATLAAVEAAGLVALRYTGPNGEPAGYPWNPNGSQNDIAGICNPAGNVLGLMPHPEDHIIPEQHPRYHRGERGLLGLPLFANGVRYAAQI